ncbi:MAG: threonylcarbamoyl-AMP synthase [Planctomycetales bacterium]|nr:threonylcarbamoyl-AMP synthase [Planctomycetales bacterium]
MQTRLIDQISDAAEILRRGGLVAFATETVFGLGADARSGEAIERLFAAKGRPSDNPLIVHLSDMAQYRLAARELPPMAEKILRAFSPGPVTVVLPKSSEICPSVTAGLDSVGIRIPAAAAARELLRVAGIPIAAPSANLSGRPSCTTWQSVLEDLDGRIDAILTLPAPHVGLESTVVDCTGPIPLLLRPGAISLDDLQRIVPTARQSSDPAASRASPGLRHPHYQPSVPVVLIHALDDWDSRQAEGQAVAYCGMDLPSGSQNFSFIQQFDSVETYAQGFYEFLRAADRAGVDFILVQSARGPGLAAALFDRQSRAAGGAANCELP